MDDKYIWKKDLNMLRYIPKNAPFVFMYSGGKDSGLALSIALEYGKPVSLLHCLENDESLFHEQKRDVMNAQASQLNIPIRYLEYKWWVRWDKIVKTYIEYKEKGVKYVVFGDLNSEGNMDVQIKLCRSAGVVPCFPLAFLPYDCLLDEIEKRNIESIITTINHSSIESKWLGKTFNREMYHCFEILGIDSFGEGGEFHTTLVNANCFKGPLKYEFTVVDDRKICINTKFD
nr:hypothetical protein [uncultured Acetatifactor sp.]